jgi:tRNA dimethylallyltransferase
VTNGVPSRGGSTTGVVVLGPTASGKSDVAMALATAAGRIERFEIVAVDAMQVYRGMDIGTAKPSPVDQALVPHHGIDLVDPTADFAVAEYVGVADAAIDDVRRRGAIPILVGGTGLYLRALTDPMEIPGTWPDVRAELEQRAGREPVAALHAELIALDPAAAAKMEPSNARRIVRALEVCIGSGRPFSSFGPGLDAYPPIELLQIGLRWGRPELAARIEQRVHRMMDAGLLDEVTSLRERFPVWSRTASQALGYKELVEHLDGLVSLDEAVATVVQRTRQFAVRQERWFRRDPRIQWVDIHDDPVAEVLPVIGSALGR